MNLGDLLIVPHSRMSKLVVLVVGEPGLVTEQGFWLTSVANFLAWIMDNPVVKNLI